MQITPWSAALARTIAPMFAPDCPIPIRLWAVLDGTIGGRIVVDSTEQPTCALVQEMTEYTTYIAGTWRQHSLLEAIALLRVTHPVVVCCWPRDDIRHMLPTGTTYEGRAVDFTDRDPAVELAGLGAIPPGFRLERIEDKATPSLDGFDFYVTMFGSLERALEHTICYRLFDGETVVSEAVAGPFARGIAEIGIGTNEAYRRQGLGTITAAHVIQACEGQGYQAFWNAAETNEPSVALARRMGFRAERPFEVVYWPALT